MFLDGIYYLPAQYDEDFNVIRKRIKICVLEIDWRKSNQIHKWFVDNVQYGNDDCNRYEVSKEQLQELQNLCKKVLNNHELAKELLPTQSGFFFGPTEYDEFYFQDLEYTIKEIDKLLKLDYHWYEYFSSW